MASLVLWDAFVLGVFVFIGGTIFLIDDLLGTAIFALWYRLTTKKGLAIGTKFGFIGGRSTETRIIYALVIGIFAFIELHSAFATTFAGNTLVFLVAIVGVFLGFTAGPLFVRAWNRRGKVVKTIEKIEKGDTHIVESATQTVTDMAHNAANKVTGLGHNFTDSIGEALSDFAEHLPGAGAETPATEPAPATVTEASAEVAVPTVEEPATPVISEHDSSKAAIDEFNRKHGNA